MKRYPTGILDLDSQIGGGFPEGSVILLLEDPGAEAEILSFYFVVEGLKKNEKALYITTDDTMEEIKESLKVYFNIPENISEKIKFIDLMSSRIVGGCKSFGSIPSIYGDAHNQVINGIFKECYDRIVLNNLAYFTKNYDRDTVMNLLENLSIYVKRKKSVVLILLPKGLLDSSYEVAIKHVVDGVIEMSIVEAENEVQRRIKILKLKRTIVPKSIFRYEITDKGISLESVKRIIRHPPRPECQASNTEMVL